MMSTPILGDQPRSYNQENGVIRFKQNIHFAKSCEACIFYVNHVHAFETHVELDCNWVAFGIKGLSPSPWCDIWVKCRYWPGNASGLSLG